jgi:SAM-dependent methyltransferase
MTWEEIIQDIRTKPEFEGLVRDAYLGADLADNVKRFAEGDEFNETLILINSYGIKPPAKILDIGAGNGIASVAFALKGFEVTALEPDPSNTIGSGAIRKLAAQFKLNNLHVIDTTAENLATEKNYFDLVYIRQAVHHAHELKKFVQQAVNSLKPGGLYLALRDHVIYDAKDKEWFLQSHPLHKYYGGENAFTLDEYTGAMQNAGLINIQHLSYYNSPLNYLPLTTSSLEDKKNKRNEWVNQSLRSKLGPLGKINFVKTWYTNRVNKKLGPVLDEKLVPGRPYTFIGTKQV